MQTSLINSITGSMPAKAMMPLFNGRPIRCSPTR